MDPRRSKSAISRKSRTPVRKIPSKIFRNPFLNFLKDLRKSNKNKLGVTELTKRGGQIWRSMSAREKSPYINISKQAPKITTSRSRHRRRRRRSRRRGRRSKRGRRRRSSSSSQADDSEERRPHKHHQKDRQKVEENKNKSANERNHRGERDEQKGSHKHKESDRRGEDGELRLKSTDYDDIKRDYI